MKSKNLLVLITVLIFGMLIVACGGAAEETADEPTTSDTAADTTEEDMAEDETDETMEEEPAAEEESTEEVAEEESAEEESPMMMPHGYRIPRKQVMFEDDDSD